MFVLVVWLLLLSSVSGSSRTSDIGECRDGYTYTILNNGEVNCQFDSNGGQRGFCSYYCHRGYDIHGPHVVNYHVDLGWNGKKPKCYPIQCPKIEVENGDVNCSDLNFFKSQCRILCNPGYQLSDANITTLTCGEERQWSEAIPKCISHDGIQGLKGDKGDNGEMGFPGNPGLEGPQGPKGDRGDPGTQGNDGIQGLKGDKGDSEQMDYFGLPGMKGEPGQDGFPGEPGLDGSEGPKGDRGDPGTQGYNGIQGPKGDKGDSGQMDYGGLFGEKGERGLRGIDGYKGDRGEPGLPGSDGEPGIKGEAGAPGAKGDPGIQGPEGPQGPKGDTGEPGTQGLAGPVGIRGPRGIPGLPGSAAPTGYLLVRHSQTLDVPDCFSGHTKLWEGYSLLHIEGNERSHYQELGSAGSCLHRFSIVPFLSCNINSGCNYTSINDRSYWLTTNKTFPMTPVSATDIQPYISRCVVCETPSNVIAVHSQTLAIPDCPTGWSFLWIGYSFVMHTAASSSGGGQSLSNPGSCLEEFHATPFIECSGARGTCHHFGNKHSFWLSTVEINEQFKTQSSQNLRAGNLKTRVSRCIVCSRNV